MSVSLMNQNSSSVTPNNGPSQGDNGADTNVKATTLFAWVKVYSSVALWSMASSMIGNSDAIQKYIYDGLNNLSLAVMRSSQVWSSWNIGKITADQKQIQDDLSISDPNERSTRVNADTTTFNTDNTIYQQFLQWFNSVNDGINNTSSNTTQTQTQDNSNIQQGPVALLQMMANIWTVIA